MALKTDKQQIIDTDALIYDSAINHITGDADNDLRQDIISSKANVDMITKQLREYNSNWVCKGAAWVGLTTPVSPSTYDAYMVLEAGIVFGISGCQKYNILVFESGSWYKYDVNLNDYYYTKAEVDALITPGPGGTYYSETLTGKTIEASKSTIINHTLGTANISIEITDSSGETYNFPIKGRTSTTFTVYNGSPNAYTNMKAFIIKIN